MWVGRLEEHVLDAYLQLVSSAIPTTLRAVLERHYLAVRRSIDDLNSPWRDTPTSPGRREPTPRAYGSPS